MLTSNVRPSSIKGIKRLAKRLKKSKGVRYSEALNLASRASSFHNFAHARSSLSNHSLYDAKKYQLFVTVYWEDKEIRSFGRETLRINISKPLGEICSTSEMKITRNIGWFRSVAQDHIVSDRIFDSQDFARNLICGTVRILRFMEATGLKPVKNSTGRYPGAGHKNDIPGCDHVTEWIDPVLDQFIVADEPYLEPVVNAERRAWAEKNGWHIEILTWPGMYFPGRCPLFIFSDATTGYDFVNLVDIINKLPEPVTIDNWSGESVCDHEVFLSPLAVTRKDKKRAKAKGLIVRVPNRVTVPMSRFSEKGERRPNSIMPLSLHQDIGQSIKVLLQSGCLDWCLIERMNQLRSVLENWLFLEHDEKKYRELDFIKIYYGNIYEDIGSVSRGNSDSAISLLRSMRKNLVSSYPNCLPLRQLLRNIDFSIVRLEKGI